MNTIRPVIVSSFGPPALACIRSWGRKGMAPGMVVILNSGETAAASRYFAGSCILPRNLLYTDEGLGVIARFLASFKADGVFCIDEKVAVWLNDSREKMPRETALWLPTNDMIHRSLPKVSQIEAARHAGFTVPPTYLFSTSTAADVSIPATGFPLCLRPSEPDAVAPPFKVQMVRTREELQNFLENHETKAPVIGQPFLNLPNLVVHGTRTRDGDTVGLQGFLVERKFQGVTLTIRTIELGEECRQKCKIFTDALNLVGHYHFEFLYDPVSGEEHFLEFNFRFGGTTAKVLALGYDEPCYALQAFGIDAPDRSALKKATVSNIKALIKSMLFALSGKLTPLDYPEESKMQRTLFTLKSLVLCRDEVFAWDDLQGTSAFYLGRYYAIFNQSFVKGKGTGT